MASDGRVSVTNQLGRVLSAGCGGFATGFLHGAVAFEKPALQQCNNFLLADFLGFAYLIGH
jgi:hypothetical protein